MKIKKRKGGYRWRHAHPKVCYSRSLDDKPFPPDSIVSGGLPQEEYEIKQAEKAEMDRQWEENNNAQ